MLSKQMNNAEKKLAINELIPLLNGVLVDIPIFVVLVHYSNKKFLIHLFLIIRFT